MLKPSTRIIAVVAALVGCNPMRELQYTRALERSLQEAYPGSSVSATLSSRHVLTLTFDPLPKSVASSSNKPEALRLLASKALHAFAQNERVDSVEISEVTLGIRIRRTGLWVESAALFPASDLNSGQVRVITK